MAYFQRGILQINSKDSAIEPPVNIDVHSHVIKALLGREAIMSVRASAMNWKVGEAGCQIPQREI